jgi:hypothetical protein
MLPLDGSCVVHLAPEDSDVLLQLCGEVDFIKQCL